MALTPVEILEIELEKYESAWKHLKGWPKDSEDYKIRKKNLERIIPQYKKAILTLVKSENSMGGMVILNNENSKIFNFAS